MIYIAGKISGLDKIETEIKFQKAENELRRFNLKVINPLKLGIPHSWSWNEQIDVCKKVISKCVSAVYFLADWAQSPRAIEEFKYINELNKTRPDKILIYYESFSGLMQIRTDVEDGVLTCTTVEKISFLQ